MICYAVPVLANQYISTQKDLLYFKFSAEFNEFTHTDSNLKIAMTYQRLKTYATHRSGSEG